MNNLKTYEGGILREEIDEPVPLLKCVTFVVHRDPDVFEVLAQDIIARLSSRNAA